MIKIESFQESRGPISGSPTEGSGVLFILQGVITSEGPGSVDEECFHAIPLDVFSELVLTQGFSPDDVDGMARHILTGGNGSKAADPSSQDPNPLLMEVKERERAAVARELRSRRNVRPSRAVDLDERGSDYWGEVASISDFLVGGQRGDSRTLTGEEKSLQDAYRQQWRGMAPPDHGLDEKADGWVKFVSRVKELRTERDKGARGLVHQLYGEMILRSLTEEAHVLEPAPLPTPRPDPRVSPTGQEVQAEEDGST